MGGLTDGQMTTNEFFECSELVVALVIILDKDDGWGEPKGDAGRVADTFCSKSTEKKNHNSSSNNKQKT